MIWTPSIAEDRLHAKTPQSQLLLAISAGYFLLRRIHMHPPIRGDSILDARLPSLHTIHVWSGDWLPRLLRYALAGVTGTADPGAAGSDSSGAQICVTAGCALCFRALKGCAVWGFHG